VFGAVNPGQSGYLSIVETLPLMSLPLAHAMLVNVVPRSRPSRKSGCFGAGGRGCGSGSGSDGDCGSSGNCDEAGVLSCVRRASLVGGSESEYDSSS
jgi:hypothetical protein